MLVLRSKLTLNRDFVDRIVLDNYAAERSPSFKLMLGLCARGMANDDQDFGSLESLLFKAVDFSRKPSQPDTLKMKELTHIVLTLVHDT
jgi:hypothetical protein